MRRIQQLPAAVVTKIAAGEVIERPASVVKELLENSVDAGSTRIAVEIEQGGTELIRIVDDGHGIEPDDLPLAFASHATSKLASAEDLFQIDTLGFRGEALASIGGVAQVALQSRPPDRPSGAEVSCHGGELSPLRPWNGAPGTRIEVRHLFFNTPARRKFLRTVGTEMGHISEVFTRLALSHFGLHLGLRHNGKEVYEISAETSLRDRLGLFFGSEVRDKVYPLEARQGEVLLKGFLGDPSCERGNAKLQYLFVNGRCIRDRTIAHAVQEAYRGLVMTGRYPVTFLYLDLPPNQVDVNVHPTKSEVRFRDGNALHHLVFAALRERLQAENLTAKVRFPSTLGQPQAIGGMRQGDEPFALENTPPAAAYLPFPSSLPTRPPADAAPSPPSPGQSPAGNGTGAFNRAEELAVEEEPTASLPAADDLKAIQLYDTYLVLETPEGMLLIDQHALHERILFEQFKQRFREGTLESQRLLIPEPVDLSAEQAAKTLEQRAALAELGLGVEDFGGGTVLMTSYPTLLGKRPPREILKTVVDYLMAHERPPTREHFLNDLLSLMACHAAVRAGDRLSEEEIGLLAAQRELAHDTHHCPHGRPTALLFSRHDLERQFRRV